jgi:hypothetical protein
MGMSSPWTSIEDEALWQLNTKLDNKWKKMSESLRDLTNKGRTPLEVKQRCTILETRDWNRKMLQRRKLWLKNLEQVREDMETFKRGEILSRLLSSSESSDEE